MVLIMVLFIRCGDTRVLEGAGKGAHIKVTEVRQARGVA